MNVLIAQHDGIPNIVGNTRIAGWSDKKNGGAFADSDWSDFGGQADSGYGSGLGKRDVIFKASIGETKSDGSNKNDCYGYSDYVTPLNISIILWKRIN